MSRIDPQSVFLNVPFDRRYSPLFVAQISGLTALGLIPRCVLEIPSGGRNRLQRIYGLLSGCGASIHDLSRVSVSSAARVPRFNMPFELGIAYGLAQTTAHRFFVFEQEPYRLQVSLSDLNGHDPLIHGGTQKGVLRALLDGFSDSRASTPSLQHLAERTRNLVRLEKKFERDHEVDSPFSPNLFRLLVEAALTLG